MAGYPALLLHAGTVSAGLLYLLSCLARFEDMRGELEGAGAVDVLLELLGSCDDTKVQASIMFSVSLWNHPADISAARAHQAST